MALRIISLKLAFIAVLIFQVETASALRFDFNHIYGAAIWASDVDVADIDGVNGPDIAVTNTNGADSVSIFFNDGQGNFPVEVEYPDVESNVLTAIALSDVDQDGDWDLIYDTNDNPFGAGFGLRLNDGAGNFGDREVYFNRQGHLLAADIDGVNGPDILATAGSEFAINFNLGDGTFSSSNSAPAMHYGPNPAWGLAVGDLDGVDGLDVVIANGIDDSITTLMNDGTGQFYAAWDYAAVANVDAVAIADFDGVNGLDVAAANRVGDSVTSFVSIFLNTGFFGYLSAKVDYPTPLHMNDIQVADFNRDGWPDLVVCSLSNISILLNNGNGTFAQRVNFAVNETPGDLRVADFNQDRWPDIVSSNSGSSFPEVLTLMINTAGKPADFSFSDLSDVTLDTQYESSTITVSNLVYDTDIWISDGEYSVNGGAYTSVDGLVGNGDVIRVRHTSSSDYASPVNTVLTIGGVSDTFTSTTLPDTVPDAFAFTDQTLLPISTVTESDLVTIAGLGVATTISISGGEYRINGGIYTSADGSIVNGDTVQLRRSSSGTYSDTVDVVLTVGGVSDTFSLTTKSAGTPDAFMFTDQSGVDFNTLISSDLITISGLGAASNVSISNGFYSVNGGAFVDSSSSVTNGDTIQVQHSSSSSSLTSVDTLLTIGEFSDTFTSTTKINLTPDAFIFSSVFDAELNALQLSNTVTISGLGAASMLIITDGEYSLNGGTFISTSGNVNNGDTLQLRHHSSLLYNTETSTAIVIGDLNQTFVSRTKEESIVSVESGNSEGEGGQRSS